MRDGRVKVSVEQLYELFQKSPFNCHYQYQLEKFIKYEGREFWSTQWVGLGDDENYIRMGLDKNSGELALNIHKDGKTVAGWENYDPHTILCTTDERMVFDEYARVEYYITVTSLTYPRGIGSVGFSVYAYKSDKERIIYDFTLRDWD